MTGRVPDEHIIKMLMPEGCLEILEPFLYDPYLEMYQSEIIRVTGIPKTRALRLIKALTKYGLLNEKEKAGSKFYTVSGENPVLKQIKILKIISRLYELTCPYKNKNFEVFLFGSAARGEDTKNSDIDILIITNAAKKNTYDIVDKIKDQCDRDVNAVIYTPMEYANLHNNEKNFYEQIERYKIRVL